MHTPDVSRRELLIQGSADPCPAACAVVGASVPEPARRRNRALAGSAGCQPERRRGREPAAVGKPGLLLYTPNDKFFRVSHYDKPVIDDKKWNLEITGLVKKPMNLTLPAIKARPKQEVVYTIECGGNHGFPWFTSGIGTAKWGGTPLATLLKQAGVHGPRNRGRLLGRRFGHRSHSRDEAPAAFRAQHVAGRCDEPEQPAVLRNERRRASATARRSGAADCSGLVWHRERQVAEPHRSAGHALHGPLHGARLCDDSRGATQRRDRIGRNLRWPHVAEVRAGEGHAQGWPYRIVGAAWGAPIARVEVQVDGGPWRAATIDKSEQAKFAWTFWSVDWPNAAPGEHTITSRAVDTQGNVQPAMDAPSIAKKKTYWESNGQVARRVRIA